MQQFDKTRSKYNNGDCNCEKYILTVEPVHRFRDNHNHRSITLDKDTRTEVHIRVLTSSKVHP